MRYKNGDIVLVRNHHHMAGTKGRVISCQNKSEKAIYEVNTNGFDGQKDKGLYYLYEEDIISESKLKTDQMILDSRKENFKVGIEHPIDSLEEGEILLRITANGFQWQTLMLLQGEIDRVIEALKMAKGLKK